jgi:hypothetical protein
MSGAGIALLAVVMAVGLIGTVVPVLPGLFLIWGAGLLYGILAGFGGFGIAAFAVMTLLLGLGTAMSYVLPKRAGERSGAPRSSIRLGIVGAVVGFFVIPVIGLPIGGALGVLVGEYNRLGTWPAAWATTRAVLGGFGLAVLAEFTAGVLMVGTWAGWVALD